MFSQRLKLRFGGTECQEKRSFVAKVLSDKEQGRPVAHPTSKQVSKRVPYAATCKKPSVFIGSFI